MSVFGLLLVAHVAMAAALVRRVVPARGAGPLEVGFQAALALSTGLVTSGIALVLELRLGGSVRGTPRVDLAVLLALGVAWLLVGRRDPVRAAAPGRAWRWAVAAWVLGLLAMTAAFALDSARNPHGGWDALGWWNVRGRMLLLDLPGWPALREVLEAPEHPDYPLLVPAALARLWLLLGDGAPAPAILGYLCTLATVLLVTGFLARTRGANTAWLGGLLLLGTSHFWKTGVVQYADVPLALQQCAALLLLYLALEDRVPRSPGLALSGLFLGAAAFTKNEGLALAAVTAALLLGTTLAGRLRRRDLAAVLLGMLPALLPVVAHRLDVGVANEFAPWSRPGDAVGFFARPDRHGVVLWYALQELFAFGNGVIPVALLLALAGRRAGQRLEGRAGFAVAGTAVAAILVVYHVVFVCTPRGQVAHLDTAARRLFCHVWPVGLALLGLLWPWGVRPDDASPSPRGSAP